MQDLDIGSIPTFPNTESCHFLKSHLEQSQLYNVSLETELVDLIALLILLSWSRTDELI